MILQSRYSESDFGLTFTMDLHLRGNTFVIEARADALTDSVLVCETTDQHEAARRWDNTWNDLTDLQRIGARYIRAGVPTECVASAFRRLRETRGTPVTNYLE